MQLTVDRAVCRRRSFVAERRGGTTIEYAALLGLLVALAVTAAVSMLGSTRSMTESVTEYFMVGSGERAPGKNGHLGGSNSTAQHRRPGRDEDRTADDRLGPPDATAGGTTTPEPPARDPDR